MGRLSVKHRVKLAKPIVLKTESYVSRQIVALDIQVAGHDVSIWGVGIRGATYPMIGRIDKDDWMEMCYQALKGREVP